MARKDMKKVASRLRPLRLRGERVFPDLVVVNLHLGMVLLDLYL